MKENTSCYSSSITQRHG